jgi:hypothetical protein
MTVHPELSNKMTQKEDMEMKQQQDSRSHSTDEKTVQNKRRKGRVKSQGGHCVH